MAQEFTYYPKFSSPNETVTKAEEPATYYQYDVGNAGRLSSALPQYYYQAYAPATVYPTTHVAYYPMIFQTPNVPAHCVPAFYAENAATAPVFWTPPESQPYSTYYPQTGHYRQSHYYPVQYAQAPVQPVAAVPSAIQWQGSSKAEVDMQNRAIHAANAKPCQLAPYQPADSEQFWCRELDGSYTLRTAKDIQADLQPGHWQAGSKGVPYFVRTEKKE